MDVLDVHRYLHRRTQASWLCGCALLTYVYTYIHTYMPTYVAQSIVSGIWPRRRAANKALRCIKKRTVQACRRAGVRAARAESGQWALSPARCLDRP